MSPANLIYVCDGMGSVFDSQVVSSLQSIYDKNVFNEIFMLLGVRNKEEEDNFKINYNHLKFKTVTYKTYPNYPVFNSLSHFSLNKAFKKLDGLDMNITLFHTRGEMSACHLMNILDKIYHKNILADVRGASVEEIEEFYYSNGLLKSLKIKNSRNAVKNLSNIKTISVVSDSLKKYLIENFNIIDRSLFVTPCLAGSGFIYNTVRRYEIRRELNLNDEDTLIIFASGGTAAWQNNEIILRFAEKDFKVLNLSKKEIRNNNIINMFVDYSEIPAYLNAADAAVIWRDKSIVNKVASPVKFSEYICCGLPVIANSSVDMITEYLTNYDCGILIDNFDEINVSNLTKLKQKDRKKISESAIKNFGIETVVDKYLKIYSSIINL